MTLSLGDAFPSSFKDSFSNRKLKPGAVFRLHVPHTTPPKIKRFVVLGIDANKIELAFIFINSNPAPNPALRSLQLRLPVGKCPFLDHDSYLDCSQVYEWELQTVKNQLMNSLDVHIGELNSGILKNACNAVASAKTVAKRLKNKYKIKKLKS